MKEMIRFQELMSELVVDRKWEEIYRLSSLVQREFSILIDANDAIWIDVGDQSQVALSPPYGSKLPFKLWVHTHPNMTAYWSRTDQESLRLATNILDTAYVLGGDGILFSKSNPCNGDDLIPGLDWSKQNVTPWDRVDEVVY